MHINDTYALRALLRAARAGLPVDTNLLDACLTAVQDEIDEFEVRLEIQARSEEYVD